MINSGPSKVSQVVCPVYSYCSCGTDLCVSRCCIYQAKIEKAIDSHICTTHLVNCRLRLEAV
jgi:hypothetical protein